MSQDGLAEKAAALGIKVDGRWSDARIQQEIDSKTAVVAKPEPRVQPATVTVRINRDIWVHDPENPGEPIRHRKGSIREVSLEQAFDGIESGALSRVK